MSEADEEFSWSDSESVVVKTVHAIAVYPNPSGDIVIRQQGPDGEDDSFVIFPVDHVDGIITAIKKAVSEGPS
jgi:hypothetical protein